MSFFVTCHDSDFAITILDVTTYKKSLYHYKSKKYHGNNNYLQTTLNHDERCVGLYGTYNTSSTYH